MRVRHLSEEDVQGFLDDDGSVDARVVSGHVRACDRCARLLSQYRILYSELGRDSVEMPSPALIDAVLRQAAVRPSLGWAEILAWTLAGAAGIAGTSMVLQGLAAAPTLYEPTKLALATALGFVGPVVDYGLHSAPVFAGIVGLALFGLLERRTSASHRRHADSLVD
jgi:hypothetical protein